MRKLHKPRPARAGAAGASAGGGELATHEAPGSLAEALALIDEYRTQSIELRMMLDAMESSHHGKHNGNGNGNGHPSSLAVDAVRAELIEERATAEELRTQLVKAHGMTDLLRGQLEASQFACEQARQEVGEEKSIAERLRGEVAELRASVEHLQRELESERAAVQHLRLKLTEASSSQEAGLGEELEATQADLDRSRAELLSQRENIRQLEEEIESERKTNAELRGLLLEQSQPPEPEPVLPERDAAARVKTLEMELYLVQQRNAMLTAKLAELEQERDRSGSSPAKPSGLAGRLFGLGRR